jgi:hypothetical protein
MTTGSRHWISWLGAGLVGLLGCLDIDRAPSSPTAVRRSLDPDPGAPSSGMPLSIPDIPFDIPGGAGDAADAINEAGDRIEQCFERGGTLAECAGTAALCFLRDKGVELVVNDLAEKLHLFELFKNYYCDGECYHCCWVPGTGPGGAGGGCHTSFDASDGPVINCNPGTYGPGTQDLGAALVIGDALGLGICIGGVQQLCNHIPACNGAGSSALGGSDPELAASGAPSDVGVTSSALLEDDGGGVPMSVSPPPHPNMSHPGAAPRRAKSFEAAARRNLAKLLSETPARERRRAYVDFATARGAVNWMRALGQVEPYNGAHEEFQVTNAAGQLRTAASYHQGMLFHATLALMGAVPNLQARLEYVESRYWTEDEKDAYLGDIDPETELLKTMGPIALAVVKGAPIQDWRLLAVPAPNEAPLGYRSFEGFRLGQAPIVTLAQDCAGQEQVSIAVGLQDPEQAQSGDTSYRLTIDWGDGAIERRAHDSALPANVFQHTYAAPGRYLAYVTASNSTGLRGVAGLVVDSTATPAAPPASPPPALATVQLDDVEAYGPALIAAGDLGLTVEVARAGAANRKVGWSDARTLPNKGATVLGDVIGYNEALAPVDAIVLRATRAGGYYYESVYLKAPSITLGVQDASVGGPVTRTTPLTADMLRIYYVGATAPVPAALVERDVNGDLLLPIERKNALLPAGFCGASACSRIDRIEIPITASMLGAPVTTVRPVPGNLPVGGTGRWVEDVPNVFVPVVADSSAAPPSFGGSCQGSLQPQLVEAAAPVPSLVVALAVAPAEASVSTGAGQALQALATLADGSTLDVTDKVAWSSSADPVARVSTGGADKGSVAAAIVPGSATITASLGGLTASALVTNTDPPRGFRSYRVLIQAVHGNVGRAGITGVELTIDGRVQPSLMTAPTAGSIGPFPATVASSSGSVSTNAFDVSLSTSWTSSNGTFDKLAPYGVLGNPVYLQVDFTQPIPVHGIRLHRQGGILSASYKPQFPKQVAVQGSHDGVTFETITQTTFEGWNGQPAVVEWTVPPPVMAAAPPQAP